MQQEQIFDVIMTICDWDKSGNDELVLSPLVEYLSQQSY